MKYTFAEHKAKLIMKDFTINETIGVIKHIDSDSVKKLTESAKGKKKRKLIVQMEAIHVGRTANYTFYTEQGLKDGLSSWTHPYEKPVLTHHNSYRGEPVGRIIRAEFSESTVSGRKGLIFTCEITDPDAIEKVLDGRYKTVSIGASTDKVTCNICGTDRAKEWCEHWRGEEYEGQTCHYVIGTTMGKEVSYVNVPADEDAGNISVSIEDEDDDTKEFAEMKIFQIAEGLMENVDLPGVNLYESVSDDIKGLVDGLLETEEGSVAGMTGSENKKPETNISESELQEKLNQAQGTISKLEGELSNTQKALSEMTIEKLKAESFLEETKADIERLTIENADLIKKSHRALAEKVVEMKLLLRKSDVIGVKKEEAIEAHIKRTEESLSDAVNDLQAEMKDTTALQGVVKNPGVVEENIQLNEGKDEKKSKKITISDAADIFKSMLGANKR